MVNETCKNKNSNQLSGLREVPNLHWARVGTTALPIAHWWRYCSCVSEIILYLCVFGVVIKMYFFLYFLLANVTFKTKYTQFFLQTMSQRLSNWQQTAI